MIASWISVICPESGVRFVTERNNFSELRGRHTRKHILSLKSVVRLRIFVTPSDLKTEIWLSARFAVFDAMPYLLGNV